ncbi:hypothetical protein RJ639_006974 [Escallonia herrerae]|uniref:Reverse transcriptase/retrotransposon-derived protein RNase H-like domain-containing protein n=1 Tax=Escallonia herrerae TaxID=1293975 RepID=A0AA88VVL5_9ASTE|nr:hypothetical protein RJ639_006974 [Escallonia herrerae]
MALLAERCLPFFKAIRKSKDFTWTDDCQKSFEELNAYLGSPPLLSKSLPEEELFQYLLVIEVAISVVLVRENDGVQKPIYYVIKVLQDVEMRYAKIDKIALALTILQLLVAAEHESFSSAEKVSLLSMHFALDSKPQTMKQSMRPFSWE